MLISSYKGEQCVEGNKWAGPRVTDVLIRGDILFAVTEFLGTAGSQVPLLLVIDAI
jgi:hypothetical protein